MPTTLPPGKVLVTGANGFLATWICRLLLQCGYSVRGTVRSDPKGSYLRTVFAGYGDLFEYVIVRDMSEEGAFDNTVKDVDAVIHTAAKATSNIRNPSDLIGPNVAGVVSLLNSVLRYGSGVRRFVYTSTTGVLTTELGATLTENTATWNEEAVHEVNEKQAGAPGHQIYLASKVLTEKAALQFVAEHKKELKGDFVSLLAPWLIGPQIQESDLTEAMTIIYDGIEHEQPPPQRYAHMSNWADVRDVALAHVLSLQKEKAGGERFIISAGSLSWQDIYDALNSQSPPLPDIPFGDPQAHRGPFCTLSSAKAVEVLSISYRSLRESLVEAVIDLRAKLRDLEE